MKFDLESLKAKAKEMGEKAKVAAGDWKEKADRAAEVVAAKCTELTGRETSADEVKKAAMIAAGAVVVGTVALAVVAAAPGEAITAVAGSGGDFEEKMTRGFAELGGSLNFTSGSGGVAYADPFGLR